MNRSVVAIPSAKYLSVAFNLSHEYATLLASDLRANEGLATQVVRLPRRLFRGRVRANHNAWMLQRGARISQIA